MLTSLPECTIDGVEPWKLGDGECDLQNNFTECDYDGQDCCPLSDIGNCIACMNLVDDPSRVGNGICDFGFYMTPECDFDGGDCLNYKECNNIVEDIFRVGDGNCNEDGLYMSAECAWDGGDCFDGTYGTFGTNISIIGDDAIDDTDISLVGNGDPIDGGVDFINYNEDIITYFCNDDFKKTNHGDVTNPLRQGDVAQICVKTKYGSFFAVHSIQELDVYQNNDNLYPYIDNSIPSPLATTACPNY